MIKPQNWGFKMNPDHKNPVFSGKSLLICLITVGILIGLFVTLELIPQNAKANLDSFGILKNELIVFQNNTLSPIANPSEPASQAVRKIKVIVTGYSSTTDQTDSDPFVTAAGTRVEDGVIANNYFPFGTKIRIPELYGDKVFVVEDRMSWKKGNYHFDIWFPNRWQALDFGAKQTIIEVLES